MQCSTVNQIAIAFGLLAGCLGAQAVGLGQVHSTVVMGERLAVVVPLKLAPGERADDLCVSAGVRFGDEPVPGFQVGVRNVAGSGRRGAAAVQVYTRLPVSEPWVTLQVTAGCDAPVSRRYVLMADAPGATPPRNETQAKAAALTQPQSQPQPQPQPPVRAPRHARTAEVDRARLVLDPAALDALVEPTLRLDMTLRPAFTADLPVNVQAQRERARAHWWALQATPQEANALQARLQDLEQHIADLQAGRLTPHAAEASAEAASDAVPPQRITSSKQLPVDESEVANVRLVGLIGVAAFALAALAYRKWQAQPVDWASVPQAAMWLPPQGAGGDPR